MNYFPEYGQAVTYNNLTCYIIGRRKFTSIDETKITLYHVIAKHFEDWVDSRELRRPL